MSSNHPISESDSEWEDFLPPGLQSDASSDSSDSDTAGAPKSNRTSSLDDNDENSHSRHSSKTPSIQGDDYLFEDNKGDSIEDPSLTRSFVSVPEGLEPTGKGGVDGSGVGKSTKTATKRKRRKSGAGVSPRRRRKKKVKEDNEEGDDEGDDDDEEEEDGDGSGKKKGKGKSKGKNKPSNRRRNIKSFLREDQLDAETLEAQREEEKRKQRLEEERKRRLDEQKIQKMESSNAIVEKLQEAVATISAAIPALTSSVSPSLEPAIPAAVTIPVPIPVPAEFIVVDSGSDSDKDAKNLNKQEREVITISSDEEVTLVSDNSEDEAEMDMVSIGMHTNDEANVPDIHGRVLVNVNHPPDDPDIYLPEHIARAVKPHQVGGIRFLYDNLVESLQRFKASSGFGCILAHSMGLGKTLQCIAFTSIFMRYTKAHTVLCIVPINTLQNWLAEFDMWCPERPRHFNIFVLNDMHKTTASRAKVIGEWRQRGGVLLMGYEMYRLLARSKQANIGRPKKKSSKSGKSSPQVIDIDEMEAAAEMAIDMKAALCNPGPDMVVCDEGHRIKNSHAGISQALKNIRTRRRVVLTGYPLQNNLLEYWCMVDFVRPNFLGTRHEFANLFERPISNGQCMDSTPFDVRLMRYRAHVLHSLLSGFVQRRGFNVLLSTLPPKEEHVIMVRLTSFQRGLYIRFMQCFKEAGAGGWCTSNPLKAFSVGCKIWNHPDILSDLLTVRDSVAEELDADLDLPEVQAKCTGKAKGPKKAVEEKNPKRGDGGGASSGGYVDKVQQIISFEWARDIMKNYTKDKLCSGGKIILLFHILEESIRIGDKILVFSQSLSCLSIIEKFLAKSTIPQPPNPPPLMPREWVRNKTYFRLDGSTAVSERERMINQFNSPDNKTIRLFLLSTKAGCLGINLIGANRVVVMDASWNPCHDAQAVCRVYRYGQTKKCHVYRLVSDQTLEKKIYDRQISKKGMSDRVVDEMNPEMNLTKKEVESLLEFDESDMPFEDFSHLAVDMEDTVLKSLVQRHSNCMTKAPFTTESLLWDRKDMKLTRAEKMQAKKSYEEEKKLNLSYSRPSYTAFYPKGGQGGMNIPPAKGVPNLSFSTGPAYPYMPSLKQPLQRPVANVRPIQSTPVPRHPPTSQEVTQKRLRDLKNAGVTLQRIVATTNIMLPGANTSTESSSMIRAGDAVTFIKTKKGIYLRTHEGKILAVRGPNAGPGSLGAVAQGAFPDATPSDIGVSSAVGEGNNSSSSSTTPSNLANTQLGQLLSQNNHPPRQQSNNLPLLLPSEIKPNLSMPAMPTTSSMFPFVMSQSSKSIATDQGQSSSSTMSNMGSFGGVSRSMTSFPPYTPYSSSYSLGNTSTLTMATDTVMSSSSGASSSIAMPSSLGASSSFPSMGMHPTSIPENQSSTSFPDLYQDSSPSPSLGYPSFGDDWSNNGQGALDANQTSMSSNLPTASILAGNQGSGLGSMPTVDKPMSTPSPPIDNNDLLARSVSNPSPFQVANNSVPDGNQVNALSDLVSPSPAAMGATQSVSLPSSLPYPQVDMNYPYPSLSRASSGPSNGSMDSNSSLLDDGSDISNLSKFVDSTFPNLMPFSGSLNPDSDSSSRSNVS